MTGWTAHENTRDKGRPRARTFASCLIASALFAMPALAQETTDTATTTEEAAASPDYNFVEPEALEAVNKMASALRALPHFMLEGALTNEVVLETGQKLQFTGTVEIAATPPKGMKISVKADTRSRDYYYDGTSLTVVAPTLKYYASAPAPGTIKETVEQVSEEFGIELPLADLFLWGTDPAYVERLEAGYVVRPETIGQRSCMQYAFRQEGVDWQIWIPQTGAPLPCKLVITDTDDPSMPQYSAVLNWNVETAPAATMYAFAPPEGFTKIRLAKADEDTMVGDGQ